MVYLLWNEIFKVNFKIINHKLLFEYYEKDLNFKKKYLIILFLELRLIENNWIKNINFLIKLNTHFLESREIIFKINQKLELHFFLKLIF